MTDYAELEKRLRLRREAVRGSAGVFTTVLAYNPDDLCVEAADAISSLTRELAAGVALADDVLDETYMGHYLGDETSDDLTRWKDRNAQTLGLSTAPADKGSEGP